MRNLSFTFAILSASTLTTAPLVAQDASAPTKQESVECMMATLPFYLAATLNGSAKEDLDAAGGFWGQSIDSFGDVSDDEMDALEAQSRAMMDGLENLESEADFAAYLAPYQATFDACEAKRKALQRG
jgi:hypothetical protein